MLPSSPVGCGTFSGALPQIARTASSTVRITPKVASTWLKWSRPYKWRNTSTSSNSPSSTAAGKVSSSPAQNEPSHVPSVAAM